MTKDERIELVPEGFFVLRTPLLPVEEYFAWSSGLEASAATDEEDLCRKLAEDRRRLRARLVGLVERPEVLEALSVASPSIVDALALWRRDPESKKGARAEAALVRYFTRMCLRATPFGLFSGCTVGTIGDDTRLVLASRDDYSRRTRADNDYLFSLARALAGTSDLVRAVALEANSSLYRVGDRLRYAEGRLTRGKRSYHLVSVEADRFLDAVLEKATNGATRQELAETVVAADEGGGISGEEAEEYVAELVASQLLTPSLEPPVTGKEPLADLIEQLEASDENDRWARPLRSLRGCLADIDQCGVGQDPGIYREAFSLVEELPVKPKRSRFLQVDMVKPAAVARLGPEVLAEVERGSRILWRMAERTEETELTRFRRAFSERYGDGRVVLLAEALDPELGIGFGSSGVGLEGPLVEGLGMMSHNGRHGAPWDACCTFLMKKLRRAIADGAEEIEITEEDAVALAPSELPPLPGCFQTTVRLAARSPRDLDSGRFRVLLGSTYGPSGARMMGRFCHADAGLKAGVEAHLRFEESTDPDAIFAEVVHLPEGRTGNVICRPALRDHEIPLLARSGVKPERRISIGDLGVSVAGESIVLSSRSLGRRVVPRLTTAHNFQLGSLNLYKFLGALQSQSVHDGAFWSWRMFDGLDHLPRVVSGRAILCRARWRVDRGEVRQLVEATGAPRFAAVQAWRRERRLPRYVVLRERDNELPVDLDNALSIDGFLGTARRRGDMELTELFPPPGEHSVQGPEGSFLAELIIPYRNRAIRSRAGHASYGLRRHRVRRTFEAGSEWLYAKLYCGRAAADRALLEEISPLVEAARRSGAIDRWFFLRYSDPEWHLRVRFHGEPGRLHREVLPALGSAAERMRQNGTIWRFQLDTYVREVERYGGRAGIDLAERVAHIDSEAVLRVLAVVVGDAGVEARWKAALLGADLLFRDVGEDHPAQQSHLEKLADSFRKEHGVDRRLKVLGARYRGVKAELEALLSGAELSDPRLASARETLRQRSRALAPVVASLFEAERSGALTFPVSYINLSFIHMFVNRLIRSSARAHEAVIYDFLERLNRSRIARQALGNLSVGAA